MHHWLQKSCNALKWIYESVGRKIENDKKKNNNLNNNNDNINTVNTTIADHRKEQ